MPKTDITIPPEALRAARNAYFKATHLSWQGAVDAACLAMLRAWPDLRIEKLWALPVPTDGIILPLPQDGRND